MSTELNRMEHRVPVHNFMDGYGNTIGQAGFGFFVSTAIGHWAISGIVRIRERRNEGD